MTHRVVVTGWGAISSIGHTVPEFWSGLVEGACGIADTLAVPHDNLLLKRVAEVKNFDPAKYMADRQVAVMDRIAQFSVVASKEAITQSGISFDEALSERTAVIIGNGVGGQTTVDESFKRLYGENARRLHPLTVPKAMPNSPASHVTMTFGLHGPSFVVASACASATHAIGLAFQFVRSGSVTCAVTGGTDACISYSTLKGWEAMRVMAPDTCRPFSRDRKGMVLGEGAAALVIETLEHAQARSANILGEIVGFGMSSDAFDITTPDEAGMARALASALADAKLAPTDIQHVNAHGTGTIANDETETKAIKRVFGAHAAKLAISANKSSLGHPMGAAGAFEAVATMLALKEGIAPPTIGYLGPDPNCDLDYVPNEARRMKIDAALSNSFAFGGHNAVLAFKRF